MGAGGNQNRYFGNHDIGGCVRAQVNRYQLVGVLKHVINNSDDNLNGHVYVPFSGITDVKNNYYLNSIVMEYEGDHAKVVKALRDSLAFHHNYDPKDKRAVFVFDVFADLLDLRVITTGIKILLGFIGLLTLGIGGVGLMNIMLVSVTQRTREIGVEKALGARRRDILTQFLSEAMAITFAGGLLGVMVAYCVSWIIGRIPVYSIMAKNAEAGDIRLTISPMHLLVSTVILI